MKVIFVYHNRVEGGFMPISIATLGGALKRNGIEAKVFDTTFYRDKNSPFLEDDIDIRQGKKGGYKKVAGYDHTRETVDLTEKFHEEVEKYKPDLIAATSTSFEFHSLTDFILPTKRKLGIPVIIGGSHATVVPYEAIQNPAIDYVCVGEGERPLLELVKRLETNQDTSNIPNLVTKTNNGKIITNSRYPILHMDETPDPDWSLLSEKHRIRPFEGKIENYGFFEWSRGCPHKCSYCINSALHKMKAPGDIQPGNYRFFSPEENIRRMMGKKQEPGFTHIQLIDENVTAMPRKDFEKFAELYKGNIGVGFFTQSRPENLIGESGKAKILAEMGCKMVAMGMESGNADLRKNVLNRPMRDGVIEEAVEAIRREGMKVAAYYMIGFPSETEEMIKETIALHKRVQPDRFSVRFLHPFPGTEIRELCIKKGYIDKDHEFKDQGVNFFRAPVLDLPSPPHPSRERLIELRQEFEQ
ncbi:MAG: radical SAM protein [archaeon]